jgi:hypothetical protein
MGSNMSIRHYPLNETNRNLKLLMSRTNPNPFFTKKSFCFRLRVLTNFETRAVDHCILICLQSPSSSDSSIEVAAATHDWLGRRELRDLVTLTEVPTESSKMGEQPSNRTDVEPSRPPRHFGAITSEMSQNEAPKNLQETTNKRSEHKSKC